MTGTSSSVTDVSLATFATGRATVMVNVAPPLLGMCRHGEWITRMSSLIDTQEYYPTRDGACRVRYLTHVDIDQIFIAYQCELL